MTFEGVVIMKQMQNMKQQGGFTLIELVVVIVILGILAAVAFPRFISLTTDARVAAVGGIAGGLRSAVATAQARYYATGTNTSPITMADGTTVAVGTAGAAGGVPTNVAAGIIASMRCESTTACQGVVVDVTVTPSTWRPNGGSATCQATYNPANGQVLVVTTTC
jgi:MSHA pilin protein MshA